MELSAAKALVDYKEIFKSEKQVWADLGCGAGLFTNALALLLKSRSKIFAVDKNINAFKNLHQSNEVTIEKNKGGFY